MRLSIPIKTEADRQHFIRLASRFELEAGKEYTGELGMARKSRSDRQNRTYWQWLRFIAHEGYIDDDPDTLHEFFRQKFLQGRDICGITVRQSTTKLTTGEFNKYLEDIRMFMISNADFSLPYPESPEYDLILKAMGH